MVSILDALNRALLYIVIVWGIPLEAFNLLTALVILISAVVYFSIYHGEVILNFLTALPSTASCIMTKVLMLPVEMFNMLTALASSAAAYFIIYPVEMMINFLTALPSSASVIISKTNNINAIFFAVNCVVAIKLLHWYCISTSQPVRAVRTSRDGLLPKSLSSLLERCQPMLAKLLENSILFGFVDLDGIICKDVTIQGLSDCCFTVIPRKKGTEIRGHDMDMLVWITWPCVTFQCTVQPRFSQSYLSQLLSASGQVRVSALKGGIQVWIPSPTLDTLLQHRHISTDGKNVNVSVRVPDIKVSTELNGGLGFINVGDWAGQYAASTISQRCTEWVRSMGMGM